MENRNLDIYLEDINRDYLNKLSFSALFKCRQMGYKSSAEFISVAYASFNETFSSEIIECMRYLQACKYIASEFQITYKSDLAYLLRHPGLIPKDIDPPHKIVRKKVLLFQDIDMDSADKTYIRLTYYYLSSLKPRMRASEIDRIVDQYLTLTKNSYYIRQAALRLLTEMSQIAEFNDEGSVIGPAADLIDDVYRMIEKKQS